METDTYDLAWISTIIPPRAPYSERVDGRQWDMYKADIALLHAEGRTKPEILDMLRENDFLPSYKQLRTQMDRWALNRSNCGRICEGPGRTNVEDTEVSDSEPESSTHGLETLSESTNLKTSSNTKSPTEGPVVFPWSSFTTPPISAYNQFASCVLVNDDHSDDESVNSRQTFATNPSDSSSLRDWRQETRRLDEIRKIEAMAHWRALADAGLLTESQRSYVHKSIRIRYYPKYQCHFCKQINNKRRSDEGTCRRCRHKRCTACLDWPKPQESPGKIRSETFATTNS